MELKKRNCILYSIKTVLYISILSSFIVFVLKDYLINYFQRNTTFISRNEEVETLEFPTMIFCMRSGYRQSVLDKHNFTSIYDVAYKSFELLDELTYQHGLDYKISVSSYIESIEFEETEIFTFTHGKCHKMQPKREVSATIRVTLEIEWLSQVESPSIMEVYLVSNNSWHGLCDDILPYFHPSKVSLDLLQQKRYQVGIWSTTGPSVKR